MRSSNKTVVLAFLPMMMILLIFGAYLSQTISPVTSTSASSSKQVLSTGKTFGYRNIPSAFTIGYFTINMVDDSTGYSTNTPNGEYLGFVFAFNVTTPDGKTMSLFFDYWALPSPGELEPSWAVPSPGNATVNYGSTVSLHILWTGNDTGLYVSFLQFDEVPS